MPCCGNLNWLRSSCNSSSSIGGGAGEGGGTAPPNQEVGDTMHFASANSDASGS